MAITSRDGLIAALSDSLHVLLDKASITGPSAGTLSSLWRATGQPGLGAIPTTASACNKSTVGGLSLADVASPQFNYLAWLDIAAANAFSSLEIHDRLCHQGGLSGTLTTVQVVNLPLDLSGVSSERIGEADHSELQWWLEWYANTGVTAAVASVNVTYSDDTTGVIGVPVASTMKAPNLIPILPLPAGKTGLKAVNSVQLNVSTGIAGNFGVTCTRLRASVFAVQSSRSEILDWAALGLPEIFNDSCLMLTQYSTVSGTGAIKGVLRFVSG